MLSHLRLSTRMLLLAALLGLLGLGNCAYEQQRGNGTPADQPSVIHPPATKPSTPAGRR